MKSFYFITILSTLLPLTAKRPPFYITVFLPISFLHFKDNHKGIPITISVKIHPKLHISTDHGWVSSDRISDFEYYSSPIIESEIFKTSGGIYSGVIIPKLLG